MNFTSEASANSSYNIYLTNMDLCMYCISFLFGVPTHCYIIWLIVTASSGIASDVLNLNLSVCELGICLHSLLSIIFYCVRRSFFIELFLIGLVITGHGLFQFLICFERYLAVVHPVIFLKYKPTRYRVICCSVAWIIVFSSCVFCMFTSEHFEYNVYFTSTQCVLFLSIQLFYLVAVLRVLKQSGPGERKREKEGNLMKRKAFNLILITTVGMSMTYIPYIITGLFYIFTHHFISNLFSFSYLCFVLASFVQSALYLHRTGKLNIICHLKH